jgi:hypothetical protein
LHERKVSTQDIAKLYCISESLVRKRFFAESVRRDKRRIQASFPSWFIDSP